MLKLTLTIGGDSLTVDGDVTVENVLPVITDWLDALPTHDAPIQLVIDHLTSRLAVSTTKLQHDVGAATPSS